MSDCIEYSGARNRGYGWQRYKGKPMYAHQAAWIEVHGAVPEGLQIRHKCDNPSCINVDHMELGTHRDNMNDAVSRGTRRGSKNGKAVLTEDQVIAAMARMLVGETKTSVANSFGVTDSLMHHIWTGKRWSHLFA